MSATSGEDAALGVHQSPNLDDAIAYRLHRTNRLLLTHLARILEDHHQGLTPEKWFILARLGQSAPLRQVELTEGALEDAPNVSRLVDRLVEDGLVDRSPDPKDRRAKTLALTASGTKLAKKLDQMAIEERHRVFEGFTAREMCALVKVLDRLDDNVRPLLAKAAKS